MDQTDINILNLLQKNGRVTIKEISSKVNLTAPAVAERIKRMEDSGIIGGYSTDINYVKLGKTMQAFVAVDVEPKKYEVFCDFCKKTPEIKSHFHIIGPQNAMLHVAVSDSDQLAELLSKIQFYGVSQTSVILNTLFSQNASVI